MSDDVTVPVKPYRQVASIGGKTIFWLKALIVVAMIAFAGEAWYLFEVDESFVGPLDGPGADRALPPVEIFVAIVGLVWVVTFIIAAICFCRWKHRCYSNLPALGSPEPRYSPGWAVGSYFIPILNLFRPFRAMKDIWNGTLGVDLQTSVPAINAWWAGWIIMGIIGRMSDRASADTNTLTDLQVGSSLTLVSFGVDIVAAILAIRVIIAITEMQTNKAAALGGDEPRHGEELFGADLPASGR